ncbi:GNAT family N-acetyltransferase [Pseudomonas sp. MAFF 212408]|uniref:L-ornithine N(alpha)-acyltransferase n=1 Tax=Pseudomonas kitaguniensis TaxID=2607908 RepID=A0A5N7KT97_9PSED|nr:GNAT family N-acyltransferase [Pseudomonas kitaguniensis]MPR05347.1 GNAT family N-acetyltransferase [Pseudomonas kitaguniensis]
MQQVTAHSTTGPRRATLVVSLATTAQEVREAQQLRFTVFNQVFEMSAVANAGGINADEFDDYCDHIIVRDTKTSCVVGTYRVMSPTAAHRMGRYYAEQEFDMSGLGPVRTSVIELGHACIHQDYRSGSVLRLLWGGLARYIQRERCEYLISCSSVSASDGGRNAAALYHAFTSKHYAPAEFRVTPYDPFPIHAFDAAYVPVIPTLLKGHLRRGAWVCGHPAWDRDYNSADFFMLLPLSKLNGHCAQVNGKKDQPL